jgi:sarcosine oxidase delta subunit
MNEHVKCPYCRTVYSDLDADFMPGSLSLSSEFEEECVECGEWFNVKREITATYKTSKKEIPS